MHGYSCGKHVGSDFGKLTRRSTCRPCNVTADPYYDESQMGRDRRLAIPVDGSVMSPMRFWKFAGALVPLACGAAAQNIAPEVLLLARIKTHMREELSQLPNYTCLETIARFHKALGVHSKMKPLDTVRLEILYGNHHEWYGSPGDRSFSQDHPVGFIGSGMIGDGVFALTLNNLFLTNGATFTYRGEDAIGGRKAARYDFRLPRLLSPLQISLIGGSGTVGEEGSFWADLQSLDLLRLETRAAEIPPFLPLQEMSMNVNYARTRIGQQNVLLAQQADLFMFTLLGEDDYDRFEFTHCRAFQAQSAIRFETELEDSPGEGPTTDGCSGLAAPSSDDESVPALSRITVDLTTSITEKDAVGTVIEGRVSGDVRRKGKIIVPNASVVRGRIRRLEQYQGGGYFILGLEFTEVEANGRSLRFYADLMSIKSMDRRLAIRQTLSEEVVVPFSSTGGPRHTTRTDTITLPELPGVASFFVRGATFTLHNGFRMVWRTRGIIRGFGTMSLTSPCRAGTACARKLIPPNAGCAIPLHATPPRGCPGAMPWVRDAVSLYAPARSALHLETGVPKRPRSAAPCGLA